MPRLALALLSTGALCLSLAPTAWASGGNSGNAKLCQKDGWQTLMGSDGKTFANEEACVAYAAHGGTLIEETQSQLDCQSIGGTYAAGTALVLWTCNRWTYTSQSAQPLNADCTAEQVGDAGAVLVLSGYPIVGSPIDATCDVS